MSEDDAFSCTGLDLSLPVRITILPPEFRRSALTITKFLPKNSILSNAGLGALTPGSPTLPLSLNPVTAEMILRGSLTSRTHCTPRLEFAGVESVPAGAVQTLSGVHVGGGTRGTVDTSSPVVRVTDTVQEAAGDTSETLCAGPGTLGTFETALGVGVEDVVRQTAVQALGGVL